MHNIAAQFRVLQLQFTKIAAVIDNKNDSAEYEIVAISQCVRQHQDIISLAKDFDYAFRPITFVEFFFSGIHICFLIYQLGRGAPVASIPFLLVFLGAILVQLMIYCYGGQRVQEEVNPNL